MQVLVPVLLLSALTVTCEGKCTGLSSELDCCTGQCGVGEGDCDEDSDCAGNLICGLDNCRNFNSQAYQLSDCCIKDPVNVQNVTPSLSTTPRPPRCACSDHIEESHKGKIGRCFRQYQGKFWCYVENGAASGCSDKKKSARDDNQYWSVLACDAYDAVPISG